MNPFAVVSTGKINGIGYRIWSDSILKAVDFAEEFFLAIRLPTSLRTSKKKKTAICWCTQDLDSMFNPFFQRDVNEMTLNNMALGVGVQNLIKCGKRRTSCYFLSSNLLILFIDFYGTHLLIVKNAAEAISFSELLMLLCGKLPLRCPELKDFYLSVTSLWGRSDIWNFLENKMSLVVAPGFRVGKPASYQSSLVENIQWISALVHQCFRRTVSVRRKQTERWQNPSQCSEHLCDGLLTKLIATCDGSETLRICLIIIHLPTHTENDNAKGWSDCAMNWR